MFGVKVTWSVKATFTEVVMEDQQSVLQNEKKVKEMFRSDPKRSVRDVGAIVKIHHTTVSQFLRQQLKIFPYRVHLG